jgi:hypothetical protein
MRDLERWERAGNRAVQRWSGLVRWAFSATGGKLPGARRAVLGLARVGIELEWSGLKARRALGFRAPF